MTDTLTLVLEQDAAQDTATIADDATIARMTERAMIITRSYIEGSHSDAANIRTHLSKLSSEQAYALTMDLEFAAEFCAAVGYRIGDLIQQGRWHSRVIASRTLASVS